MTIPQFAQTCIEAIERHIESSPYGMPSSVFHAVIDIIKQEASKAEEVAEGDLTDDQCIELAQALEQARAVKIAETVAALPIGGASIDMPTPFHAGYQLAAEEIVHRLKTEVWEHCLPPVGEPQPTEQPRDCSSDAKMRLVAILTAATSLSETRVYDLAENILSALPVVSQPAQTEPTEIESVIACLEDDANYLKQSEPGCEMADNMRVAAKLLQARAMSSADAVDARRYRHLRKDDEGIEFRDHSTGAWRADCPTGQELDAAIDAAISAEGKQS